MKIIQILLKANFTNTYLIETDITWHAYIIFLCYWIIKMTYTLLLYNTIYILLNYKYATTYFYNLYYVTTFTTYFLPTLLLLFTSLTHTFISDIFSLHTIYYYIHFSHIHNVHCILPSHACPSHATSLHILPQLLPRLFIYFEKRIIYYINFLIIYYISLIILALTFEQCKNWIFVNKHIYTHTHTYSHTYSLTLSLTHLLSRLLKKYHIRSKVAWICKYLKAFNFPITSRLLPGNQIHLGTSHILAKFYIFIVAFAKYSIEIKKTFYTGVVQSQ